MLGSWYAYGVAADPDKLPYDLSFWRTVGSIAGTAFSAWSSYRRAPAALPASIATAAATVGLGVLNKRRTGAYVTRTWRLGTLREAAFNRVMPIAHAVGSVALVGLAAASNVQRLGAGRDAIRAAKSVLGAASPDASDAAATFASDVAAPVAPVVSRTPIRAVGAAASQTVVRMVGHAAGIAQAASSLGVTATGIARRARRADAALPNASAARTVAAPVFPLSGPLLSAPWYPLARKLGLYFMTFSMVGHWVEMLFCTGIKYGIFKGGYDRSNHMLWDQWLFPFPAEGTAAVLADLVLLPAKRFLEGSIGGLAEVGRLPGGAVVPLAVAASFLLNQIVCTSVDFATGMVANRNYELWDYRDMRFHFMGQVCLQNSLFYTIIATWGVWWLLPMIEKLFNCAGDTVLDGALVTFGAVFVFLELLYQAVPPPRFRERD